MNPIMKVAVTAHLAAPPKKPAPPRPPEPPENALTSCVWMADCPANGRNGWKAVTRLLAAHMANRTWYDRACQVPKSRPDSRRRIGHLLLGASMRVHRLFAAATATMIGCSSFAMAQDNPYGGGTRLTGPPPAEIPRYPISDEDKARIVTQDLAACLIKRHREAVLKAIQEDPWQENARKMLISVVDSRCLAEGSLAVPPNLMRGAFYSQFYREKFAAAPPTLPASAVELAAAGNSNLTDDAKTGIALLQFGDCVARQDVNDAHAFVLSKPGSPTEDAALSALMPHFGPCVVQGSKWTLNRSSVSAILSEVLYREGMASAGK